MSMQHAIDPSLGTAASPINILIVDDVAQNLVAMQALLGSGDLHVLTTQSGTEALELLLAHDVAVALLDVQMPEMDGFALAELMRGSQRTRDVPIIFLTASPLDPRRSFQGYDAGAVDFLHKPIDPHVIGSKVRVFAELHRQRILLRSRNEMLERLLGLQERMMAVLSHDLRNPLSVIHVGAFNIGLSADRAAAATARMIASSAGRMARMIEQLLDVSRLRAGGFQLSPREADLAATAEATAAEIRQAHPAATIAIDVHGDVRGVFDPDRLAQVFSNLLSNAVRHAGGTTVTVRLDGADEQRLRIEVRNQGRIPDTLLPVLFEPFKENVDGGNGLGLGLYIVDQFIRAHGGMARAANLEGHVVLSLALQRVTARQAKANALA